MNELSIPKSQSGEIVLYQPDENVRLEVRIEEDTVWLSQQQMTILFQTTKQNVSLHINNIFKEGELRKEATVKDYLTVQSEGERKVNRMVSFLTANRANQANDGPSHSLNSLDSRFYHNH